MSDTLIDHDITEIIHGGARGADNLSGLYGIAMGIPVIVVPADWFKHGKSAGFIRNKEMLTWNPELVIAFWDGKSKGTEMMIKLSNEANIKTIVVDYGSEVSS